MPIKYNPFTGQFDIVNNQADPGTVIGPASSTDNAAVRWDGTTGTSVQNSVVIISDAGVITGSNLMVGAGTVVDNTLVRFDGTGGKLTQPSLLSVADTGPVTIGRSGTSSHTNMLIFGNDSSTNPAIQWGANSEGIGFRNSTNDTILRLYDTGRVSIQSSLDVSGTMFTVDAAGKTNITLGDASKVGLTIKGASAQATNLLELRNNSDVLLTSFSQTGVPSTPGIVWKGSTSGTLTHNAAATTTNHTLTWPSANAAGALTNNGSGALSWSASSGANTALSNLASTAVNAHIIPAVDDTVSLGDVDGGKEFKDIFAKDVFASQRLHCDRLDNITGSAITLEASLTGDTGAALVIKTKDDATAATRQVDIQSGDGSSGNLSGTTQLFSGSSDNQSGVVNIYSGSAPITGGVSLYSGSATNATGDVYIATGGSDNTDSGDVLIETGLADSGTRGVMEINVKSLNLINTHIVSQGSAPTIAAAAGLGGTPTVALGTGSTDVCGSFTLTPGTTPAAGSQATVTFNKVFPNGTFVIITPADPDAAVAESALGVYVTSSTTAFTVNANITLVTATAYIWNYYVIGR